MIWVSNKIDNFLKKTNENIFSDYLVLNEEKPNKDKLYENFFNIYKNIYEHEKEEKEKKDKEIINKLKEDNFDIKNKTVVEQNINKELKYKFNYIEDIKKFNSKVEKYNELINENITIVENHKNNKNKYLILLKNMKKNLSKLREEINNINFIFLELNNFEIEFNSKFSNSWKSIKKKIKKKNDPKIIPQKSNLLDFEEPKNTNKILDKGDWKINIKYFN